MSYISAAQAKQIAQKAVDNLKDGTLVPKLAENLTPYAEDSGTTQTQPFFLEGTATGNGESRVDAKQVPAFAFLQEKRGNMVCVNQLIDTSFTYTDGGITVVSFSNGYLTATNVAGGNVYRALSTSRNFIKGHKYLVFLSKVDKDESVVPGSSYLLVAGTVTDLTSTSIVTPTNDYTGAVGFVFGTIAAANSYYKAYIHIVDLTQWFNGNIPAYLLSHPEAFGRYYKGSLAYEPGRLEPATGRYLTSVGRNIWDEEWEVGTIDRTTGMNAVSSERIRSKNYISVVPNGIYFYYSPSSNGYALYYDSNKNYVGISEQFFTTGTALTAPSNCYYVRFFLTGINFYNHDITITEYYTGESDYDKYYPHEVLAVVDTGTESLYSAGSAYDSKVPSGLITRRIGSVDLGTLYWTKTSESKVFYSANIPNYDAGTLNVIMAEYKHQIPYVGWNTMVDMTYEVNNAGSVTIKDVAKENMTVSEFKQAMSGVMFYYELAEPTTEQGTPFQESVPIDDFGQLSWSDTDIPQGNEIFYPVDYKAAIDTLINHTDGDATSLVRKTDYATSSEAGVVKVNSTLGIGINSSGTLYTNTATQPMTKAGNYQFHSIVPSNQHESVFYGLAKAAGANLASSTAETAPDGTNPGVYPAAAIQAILKMLFPAPPNVDGTYPLCCAVSNGTQVFGYISTAIVGFATVGFSTVS